MTLTQECGCIIVVKGFPASIEYVRTLHDCGKHVLVVKAPCKFCSEPCGNKWCPTNEEE